LIKVKMPDCVIVTAQSRNLDSPGGDLVHDGTGIGAGWPLERSLGPSHCPLTALRLLRRHVLSASGHEFIRVKLAGRQRSSYAAVLLEYVNRRRPAAV
jgi:hypothetical protein